MRYQFLLLFLLGSLPALAQPAARLPYRNLVMEGGGIRGIAYGGALAELEKQDVLAGLQRVGGTSAGAIQAALLAVGYSPSEIIEVVNRTPIQRLNDGRLIFLGGSTRLVTQYGWYRGDELTKYLSELVARKTGNPHLTLGELHALARQQSTRYRDLYTTGTNLTRQCTQVFSHENHPFMRVADAVRISMSIPLYFRAVLLDTTGHVVHRPAPGQPVEVLVDGGLLANYPIDLFDKARYLSSTATEAADVATNSVVKEDTTQKIATSSVPFSNPETLGLRLDRAEQIALDARPGGRRQLAPYAVQDFGSYVGALYTVAIENLSPARPTDQARTISISTLGFNPKIKRVSDAQKQQLTDSGRAGVQAFFGR